MGIYSRFKNEIKNWIFVFFIFTMLVGHVITFNNQRIFGVVVTLQRILVLIVTIYFFRQIVQRNLGYLDKSRNRLMVYFFAFWFIWGMVLLVINPHIPMKSGLLELSNIYIGFLFVITLSAVMKDEKHHRIFIYTIKTIGIFFLILATIEFVTRYHLSVSRLGPGSEFIAATGIFYNENDFSTVLALFIPFYCVNIKNSIIEKFMNVFIVSYTYYIIYVNDSWIVLVAVTFGLILQIWIRGHRKLVFLLLGTGIVFSLIMCKVTGTGFSVIEAQISTMKLGYGSLYNRLITNYNSIIIASKTYFLGLGPEGFTSYMQNSDMDGLLNPHNLWLEILTQYGLFISLVYVGLLLRSFISLVRIYRSNSDEILLIPITLYAIYAVVSVSSSNFLESIYQWFPLAFGFALQIYYELKDERVLPYSIKKRLI